MPIRSNIYASKPPLSLDPGLFPLLSGQPEKVRKWHSLDPTENMEKQKSKFIPHRAYCGKFITVCDLKSLENEKLNCSVLNM